MKRKEKGWKKAVVLMLALIMCISSIVVPQPEEVSAKAANRIDFKINGKAGSKVTLYAGEYVKFTIDGMWQNGDYIQTSGTNAYGDKINFKPSKELTYKSSNNAVATVTNKGVITAKKKGTCKITVTSIYNAKVKGTIKVTVSKKKQNTKITLEKLTGMHGTYAAAIPFQGGSYGIGILSREIPIKYKIIPMPGREEKRTLIIAEFKDYVFCATHQSLTPEDQLLAVPLIEKALQNVDKPIFMAGDMNSAPASVPQLELAKHFATLNDTTSYTFPADRPNRCIDYIYGYSKNGYRFDVQYRKVIEDTISSDHRPVQVIVQVKGK